jgi:hypothetical protein
MAASNDLGWRDRAEWSTTSSALECYQPAVDDVDPAWSAGVWWFHPNSAGSPTATASFGRRRQQPPSGRCGPRGGGLVTLPRESGQAGRSPPRALPLSRPTSASMTPGTIDPIRWLSSWRGWSHDRRPWLISGSRSGERGSGHPRPAALRLPARRLGPAPGGSACLGRLDGRRMGSPGRLGVPEAPGSGGWRHRGPGPRGHRPHGGRWQVPQRPRGRSESATTAWPLWQDFTQ